MQKLWFSLRYLCCRVFLMPWLRPAAIPKHHWELLSEEPDTPKLLVLEKEHAADRLCLEKLLAQHAISNRQIRIVSVPKKRNSKRCKQLLQLISEYQHCYAASVFWTRRRESSHSIWGSYFQDSYTPAGFLRRIPTLFFQARQVSAFIGPVGKLASNEAESLCTELSAIYASQREAVTGPDFSHRRTIIHEVLQDDGVKQCISQLNQAGTMQTKRAEKKARQYFKEIAADYSFTTVRFFDGLLTYLWQKIYSGVSLQGFEQVSNIAQSHQLVYVPCHRSHIDYMLLSYSIYKHGLMPPHIAAGINLNLPIIGRLLRGGGAFFIRRQFKGQLLYRAVFEAYLQAMLRSGMPIEYFIEGGRSRTGLLLPPKAGLLAMTVKSAMRLTQEQKQTKPIAFVPVYIGYEKLIESHSYINELYGNKKQGESIKGLVAARKHLSLNYGKVFVNIAKPIMLEPLLEPLNNPQVEQTTETHIQPDQQQREVVNIVNRLSHDIQCAINQAAVVTAANLVSTALLASNKHALTRDQLAQQVKLLSGIAAQQGSLAEQIKAHDAILHAKSIELVLSQKTNFGEILLLDQKGQVNATFLRNNCLHIFMLPSLIAAYLVRQKQAHRKALFNFCWRLLPFIQSELFVDISHQQLQAQLNQLLNTMLTEGLLYQNGELIIAQQPETEQFFQLQLLAGSSKAATERFFITAQCLLHADDWHYDQQSLEKDCIELAKQLTFIHQFHAPDFFDKNLFNTFIAQLCETGVVQQNAEGLLAASRRLRLSTALASKVLSESAQHSIMQLSFQHHQ